MEDYSGRQIGNYQLVRKLEKGGQASVYLGKHRYFERYAALKIMPVSLSEQDAQRFLFETRILVLLEHHRIIRVIDFFVEQGVPILVMDYIEGGSLRHHHPDGMRVPLATVVEYIKQVAEALQYAHNTNIIHRDVKPGNILLGPDKKLILSDFGLALFTLSSEQLSTQKLIGTYHYMAPEQFLGNPRRASDQYALGVIADEIIECLKEKREAAQYSQACCDARTAPLSSR